MWRYRNDPIPPAVLEYCTSRKLPGKTQHWFSFLFQLHIAGQSIIWPPFVCLFATLMGNMYLVSTRKASLIYWTTSKGDSMAKGPVCTWVLRLMEDNSIELSGTPFMTFPPLYNLIPPPLKKPAVYIYLTAMEHFVQTGKTYYPSAKGSHFRWSVITNMHTSLFLRGFSNTWDCYSNRPVELLLGVREMEDRECVSLVWAYFP